jgi:hypothetical protein
MNNYQKIREFLIIGNELELFHADMRPIDDLVKASEYFQALRCEDPCKGIMIVNDIIALLKHRENAREVVHSIVKQDGKFESAALELIAIFEQITEKFAELDGWVLSERDQLIAGSKDARKKGVWAD